MAQLERIDDILRCKLALAEQYRKALYGAPVTFQGTLRGELSSHWMVTILVPKLSQREPVRNALADNGIETRPTFHPAHTMPMYRQGPSEFPVAEDLAARGINLPSWHKISEPHVVNIAAVIKAHLM